MNYEAEIKRGIELLWLCQDLQSEKDGVHRPKHQVIDKNKTLDQFAQDISHAAVNMGSLNELLPMMNSLSKLGQKLVSEGKIKAKPFDNYSKLALDFLLKENGLG